MKSIKSTTRVQVELPDQSMSRLVSLKDKTEAASYAEVMKNALRLYEDLIKQFEDKKTFFLKDSSGKEIEYRIF